MQQSEPDVDLERRDGAFDPGEFFSSLLKQIYLDQQYVPHTIYVPVDFEDRATLEEMLSEGQKRKVQIHVPQRGEKRSLVDLVGQNAKQAFDQRFRVMKPATKAIQEALQDALMLPELPRASSASTSRTSRARRRWPRWWCGKTAR